MERTAARIRRLREVGLCLSQDDFAAALGFTKRTIGNAERGAHPPSLALRRALDRALEKASDVQRDRFYAAGVAGPAETKSIPAAPDRERRPAPTLDGLRGAVLGWPLRGRVHMSANFAQGAAATAACPMATTIAEVHRLYQLADYDAAAQLLTAVILHLQGQLGVS